MRSRTARRFVQRACRDVADHHAHQHHTGHHHALIAAAGKTNKQIAQELYVTIKTVEFHFAGAYRKLNITARAELASKLGSDAPVSQPATAA
jgi:DNA-binding NarL/FixJ family response regulator